MLQAFAERFAECNADLMQRFKDPSSAFMLAYAIIMLNTDLHNKSIKSEKRMKLVDFIKNLRGTCIGGASGSDRDTCVCIGGASCSVGIVGVSCSLAISGASGSVRCTYVSIG